VTYVYCLVRSTRRPSVRRVTGGLPGAGPVRPLDAGDGLWLIVADVDDDEYGEAAIAKGLKDLEWVSPRALGHEQVVEQFLPAAALLPMKIFTIFTNDERALAHVARSRRSLDRILVRVAGHVEWGLRLTWDEQAARTLVEQAYPLAAGQRQRSGADYLSRKRDLLDVKKTQLAEARAEATRLHRELTKHARDAVRHTSTEQAVPGSRLLLDAAYLVPSKAAGFRTALRRGAGKLESAGIAASLTGPWPPYNFISSP
jgi:hypothetical protein